MKGATPGEGGARPRVLLVDDDATLRRYVALVLEVLDLTLISCSSVAQARQVLRTQPVQLLITDLMMPGETGYVLLEELAADRGLRGPARLVVYSAGLDDSARKRLQRLGVWRVLNKPIGVQALEGCVREALQEKPAVPTAEPRAPDEGAALSTAERAAVAQYFAGDAVLFKAYRDTCVPQLAQDLDLGAAALAARDAPGLRRLAHNLKSALRLLGDEAAAQTAQGVEDAALQADWPRSASGWQALAAACRRQQGQR